jgi:hypothetical protein
MKWLLDAAGGVRAATRSAVRSGAACPTDSRTWLTAQIGSGRPPGTRSGYAAANSYGLCLVRSALGREFTGQHRAQPFRPFIRRLWVRVPRGPPAFHLVGLVLAQVYDVCVQGLQWQNGVWRRRGGRRKPLSNPIQLVLKQARVEIEGPSPRGVSEGRLNRLYLGA